MSVREFLDSPDNGRPTSHSGMLAQSLTAAVVIVIAAFLRFADLRSSPGWYTDEGSDMDIALHLMAHEIRYMSIGGSTMLVARPLALHAILAGLFRLTGRPDIVVLRGVAATASMLSVALLAVCGQRVFGTGIGLLSAALLTVFPKGLVYARIGFSYNLLQFLFLAAAFALWEYLVSTRRLWLYVAGIAVMAAVSINVLSFVFLAFAAVTVGSRSVRELLWFVPLSVSGFAVYALVMLIASPAAFLYDLEFTFLRGNPVLALQTVGLILSYFAFLNQGIWLAMGFLGTLVALPKTLRAFWASFVVLYVLFVSRSVAMAGGSFYLAIPLLPFLSIGLAAGLFSVAHVLTDDVTEIGRRLQRRLHSLIGIPRDASDDDRGGFLSSLAVAVSVMVILGLPFVGGAALELYQLYWRSWVLPPGFTRSVSDAEFVIAFVNHVVEPDAVVLASPQIAWAIDARVADFQQAAAYMGEETIHFPQDLPRDRFVFDPSVSSADLVVLDDLWRGWASESMPAVKEIVAMVEKWPLLLERGEYRIYEAPRRSP